MAPFRLTDEILIDYAAGTLTNGQHQQVENALRDNPEAQATVQRYRLAAATMADDDTVEPPAHAIERARAIFQPAAATAKHRWLDVVDTVIAKLIFDSRVQPAGVRVANTGRRVQLTYATDDVEVDVQASRGVNDDHSRWRVMGQFATESQQDEVEYAIFPVGSEQPVIEESRDVNEPFSIELPSGRYELRARIGGATVVLPDLILD